MDRIDIDNGKYTVIVGVENDKYVFKALRNGEEWMDNLNLISGSNLILTMAYEIQRLRDEIKTINDLDVALDNLRMTTN